MNNFLRLKKRLRSRDASLKEVSRVKNWSAGEFQCVGCGKVFHLYFNGGELDRHECCGHLYQTETTGTDLVIYERRTG